jgi:hypothetical protein
MYDVNDNVSKLTDKIGNVLNQHSTQDALEALMLSMVILITMSINFENRLEALRVVFKHMRAMVKEQLEHEKKMMQ